MTDDTQNLPVSKTAPKTRRPRRTSPKESATPDMATAASGTEGAAHPTADKSPASKAPARKAADTDAPPSKAKQGTRTKSTAGTRPTKSKTAEAKADADTKQTEQTEQGAAPKPRRRRASPKTEDSTPKSTITQPFVNADSSAPLAQTQEQSLPPQSSATAAATEKTPDRRSSTRRSAPAKSSEQSARGNNSHQDRSKAPMGGRGNRRVESRPDTRPDTPSGERPRRNPKPIDTSAAQTDVNQRNVGQPSTLGTDASADVFSAALTVSPALVSSKNAEQLGTSSVALAPQDLHASSMAASPQDRFERSTYESTDAAPLKEGFYADLTTVDVSDTSAPAPTRAGRDAELTIPRQSTMQHTYAADFAAPAALLYDAEENTEDNSESRSDAASVEGGEIPRKSRRGRRGGRGRSKNKARETALAEENDSAQTPLERGSFDKKPLAARTDSVDNAYDDDDEYEDDARNNSDDSREDMDTGGRRNTARASGRSVRGVRKESAPDAQPDKDLAEKAGRRKMFISVVPGEQVEVALVEDGAIHEYYLEMLHQAKTKGNIYKGVIHNIDTNLQAAFVNYGANKNGFLQIDEVHPEYYLTHHETMKGKKFPPMQKVLKAGQEVLVQVVKEPSGSKGAFLTTWLSLAGRFLVLTPGQEQIGVSRKVENDEERTRLRDMMNGIEPGEGLGVIVRTVSAGTSKTTLKNDLQYLKRLWKDIRKRGTSEPTPSLIYQEPGLAERAVRDYLTDDVCEVWVDDAPVAESLRETVSLLFPRKGDLVRVHNDLRQTLWERFNIQRQLEQIYSREVILPSGGRLVFDQTEALMAIDINSGKISGKGNFEAMALKTNVEAAECIARQLKLRDIGGQIVIDFIEMRDKNHIRDVEKTLRNAMKNDRARHDVGRMSSFGLLEIVRQRTASSALAITMEPCPACGGTGLRRNIEWQALQSMREIARQARTCGTGPCQIELSAELGLYLLNHKRSHLREMEKQHNVPIEIKIRP